MTEVIALVAAGLLGYAMISARTENSVLTAPMFFTAFGLLLAGLLPAELGLHQQGAWVHLLAEITLVLVLFTDASRIDLGLLRREHDLPLRMLGIGLPLTIAAGAAAGLLLLPELGVWEAALVAAILAPTDAALGQAVVSNPGVPVRIRQTLNVESGLNDGIALPVVLICLCAAGAAHQQGSDTGGYWVKFVSLQVTLGPLAGIVVGWLGGRLVGWATRCGWMNHTFQKLSVLGLAVLAFAGAESIGGNGFLAAFVAGLTLGNTARGISSCLLEFGETEGQLLTLLTFTAFGALFVPVAFEHLDLAIFGYAVLSLTIVRALPVVLSLRGKDLHAPTLAFLAWFGPRGIASILFALLVVEGSHLPLVDQLLAVVGTTVLLSVFAHGMTAAPLAAWYARRVEQPEVPPDCAEKRPVTVMPLRHGSAVSR